MNRFQPTSCRPCLLVLVALAALTTSGCIEAEHSFYCRYDEKKDTFSYLHVFTGIGGGELIYVNVGKGFKRARVEQHSDRNNELGYLYALAQIKKDIIVPPMWRGSLGGLQAYVRLGDRKVHEIQMARPPEGFKGKLTFPEPAELSVDISGIKIKPGAFYFNDLKHLCYYHETEIPGPVADKLLAAMNDAAKPKVIANLDEAIKAAGNPDLPRVSWGDLRKQLDDMIMGRDAPEKKSDPNAEEPMPRGPLELVSLEMLRKAAAAGELGVKRKGSRLLFQAPLSKADSKELITTLDHVKKVMLDRIVPAEPDSTEDGKKSLAALKAMIKDGFAYKFDPGQGVLVEVELTSVFKATNTYMDMHERMISAHNAKEGGSYYQRKCRATAAAMESRGVEILREFDADKLRAAYLAKR